MVVVLGWIIKVYLKFIVDKVFWVCNKVKNNIDGYWYEGG